MSNTQTDYGNWIRPRRIVVLFAVGGLLLIIAWAITGLLQLIALVLGLICLVTAMFVFYIYYCFSSKGGKLQEKLWRLTLQYLPVQSDDRVLDIGTGNGALAVLLAQAQSKVTVTGIDMWAAEWDYYRSDCEKNARLAGVDRRVDFTPGSAASLPFNDESFDAVMSHFVFHEVRFLADKRGAVTEALRVLKPGGVFAFHDMFLDSTYYGETSAFNTWLESLGLQNFKLEKTNTLIALPAMLSGRRALGCSALLWGKK